MRSDPRKYVSSRAATAERGVENCAVPFLPKGALMLTVKVATWLPQLTSETVTSETDSLGSAVAKAQATERHAPSSRSARFAR